MSESGAPDPLSVTCPYCNAGPREQCRTLLGGLAREPHADRVRLALAAAAHADPALDEWFPMRNPCGLCGSGLPQRHRVVDAIAERLAAGEGQDELAADFAVSAEAVGAVRAWMERWPGAWS